PARPWYNAAPYSTVPRPSSPQRTHSFRGGRWVALPGADGRERAEFRAWHRTRPIAPLGADGGGPRLRPADGLRPHRRDPRCGRAVPAAVIRTIHHAGLAGRPHRPDPARDDRPDRAVPAPAARRPDGREPQRAQRGAPGPRGGRRLGGA